MPNIIVFGQCEHYQFNSMAKQPCNIKQLMIEYQALQFYLMERLQLKELEKLREQKQEKQRKQMAMVSKMLQDDYVATVFNYCVYVLKQPLTENLSNYSPSNLSKFLFDEQLQKAKAIFETLPDQQATMQHFLLIMINIIKFPFEKWPYYLVGVKDMFNQIAAEKAQTITYNSFFKYVIGEVLDFKEQQQNTQFQVRFQQLKKQDYLLHDNGVKKFYYSTDTKYFMTLDESSPTIKLYNKEMRMVSKFVPNKQKHNKKYPNILHFDYSQMSSRLGIVLSDCTLSIINFHNFLNKSKYDFDFNPHNQIVITFQDQKMLQVYFIQMLNRWLLVSQNNRVYLFDYEKYKQNDDNHISQIKLENPDLLVTNVLELVNLSMICIVAGNQIYFFSENFGQVKHSKFSHGTNIKLLRYSQELGQFYLCGDEKYITIMNLVKVSDSFQIKTFDIQSKYQVCTFEVFPIVGTIVCVDMNNDVRLFDLFQGTCYQMTNYSHIVKKKDGEIKTLKISKTQFALYQTYTLVFHQEKIAIEKDTEFTYMPHTYYDEAKEEFYLSVNNQIISFSVFQGEIRKSFNLQTANVPKHDAFVIGKQTELFIIDHEMNIYEAYLKDQIAEGVGENMSYKKKINVSSVVDMFYDEEIRHAFVIGKNTVHTVRNDKMNNFTVTSSLNFQKLPQIHLARYNSHQKSITSLTTTQQFYTIDLQSYTLLDYSAYKFPVDPNNHQQILIEHFEQDQFYGIDLILNNRNEIYVISQQQKNKRICIKLVEYLPYKLKILAFRNFKYNCVKVGGALKRFILLSDSTGFMIQIHVTGLINKQFKQTERPAKFYKYPLKDLHNLEYINNGPTIIDLNNTKTVAIDKKQVLLFKGHEKQIKLLNKINLEGLRTLTISTDGHIKLWNGQEMLFHLKLPDLKKIAWNMHEIQKIKNERSVNQVVVVMNQMVNVNTQKTSPQILLKKNIEMKLNNQDNKQIKKFNINQPIQIDIENKDLEEFVHKTQNINWYTFHANTKKSRELSFTQRATNCHPWRTKQQFRKIMEKASPENKYNKKMPNDLVYLRNSLDMKDKVTVKDHKDQVYQGELTILPQINTYVAESKIYSARQKEDSENQENQNEEAFESCLYVKKKKDKKKINEFDEIDKEFKKKWLALTTKKYIPKSQRKSKPQTERLSLGKPKLANINKTYYAPVNISKYDPIKQVKAIFENHNREISQTKKGRLIKIPDLKLKRQDLYYND